MMILETAGNRRRVGEAPMDLPRDATCGRDLRPSELE